ncbi:Squalene synthase 1 [Cardamine amara subsp. amara]|uniref:Squalene synthase 1 n=1 Tax=Cardamine amara subsp. amara TaxID=228776 RepID=A0ABD1ACD8_CARAN
MEKLSEIVRHPDEMCLLLKLKMEIKKAQMQIPSGAHWSLCYSMLHNVSTSFSYVIHQLRTELRNPMCVFYLVLRALDTVEDDTSIPKEVKLPILTSFHRHIYDRDWHFSCGRDEFKVLMDQFHHVSSAFLQLEKCYQEVIKDITKRMGAGMAKFICQEVETTEDHIEYCYYVAGLLGFGLSKIFLASGLEVLTPDWEQLSNSMGLFLHKTHIIKDYLEDINEIPEPRKFWPRQIWSKYVAKLEDFKDEENSTKAVQCLNYMVTDAMMHIEDCFKYLAALRDPTVFRFCAIPQIMAIGTLSLCYDNVQVFRGVVKVRRGTTAKVMDGTKTMDDVYGAFYDFSCMLKAKVDEKDPNAMETLDRVEAVQKICRDTGVLHKRNSLVNDGAQSKPLFIVMLVVPLLAIVFAYLRANRVME